MDNHEISLDGLSVCIGIPSSRDINPLVVKSLFATREICGANGIVCDLIMVSGNAVIQWARDEVVRLFLETKATRLFCIDSDIVWEPKDFMRLLALSQKRDVVCASYTAKKDQPTFYIRYDQKKPLVQDEYGLFEIQGAGLGFTVINRKVVEEVVETSDKIYDEISKQKYASVFKISTYKGNRRGEDMCFFDSISDLGYKIYLDPSISLGHIGTKVYTGRPIDAMQRTGE